MEQPISLRPIAEDVYVAPQLGPEHMAQVAKAGIKAVVNNRPDFEAGSAQPTNADIELAARGAGLEYRFLPVSGMYQSPEDAKAMAALLAELPRPLLMFCRSGARSTRLYQLALQA